jgi:hypothetical protein
MYFGNVCDQCQWWIEDDEEAFFFTLFSKLLKIKLLSHLWRSPRSHGVLTFFKKAARSPTKTPCFFVKKKICWGLYGDHGDCTAIMLRLHGVYIATACNL